MEAACDLLESTPGLPPRDAVHAATMLTHGVATIISTDIHFDRLVRLQRIAPEQA